MTIHDEARAILQGIEQGRWGWMKVKRFDPNAHPDLQLKYQALEKHHEQETRFLIDLVKRLSEALVKCISPEPEQEHA